jgi:hypothetical protein
LRPIVEWIAFAVLRLAATCLTLAGVAFVAPALALQASGSGADWVRMVVACSFGLAITFLSAGGISLHLRRRPTTWLPDGPRSQASTGSGFDSWLILFPLTLIGVPTLMLVQLRPLAFFWRDVLALADQLNFWQDLQRNAPDSGYILMPIIAALAVPIVEAAAAAAAVLGSAFLIALLMVRSARVPRALLLCVLMQGALVLASAFGAVVVERVTPSIEALVRETPDPGGVEQNRAMDALQRYGAVVRGSTGTLAWSWGAIALWVPLLLLARGGREAFVATGPSHDDLVAATPFSAMDDQTRAHAYQDAAQQIDRSTRPSRWF